MNHVICALAIFALPLHAFAQWSNDPAVPLIVCDAPDIQFGVQALPDANGGTYVFWTDYRSATSSEIFGQHYDHDGYALWTPNGKALVSINGEGAEDFAATRLDNGSVLLAYRHTAPGLYEDTLSAMAFDSNGDPTWAQATLVAYEPDPVGSINEIKAAPSPGGAMLAWKEWSTNMHVGKVTRIANDGSLPWGPNSYSLGHIGPFQLIDDGATGVIAQWLTGDFSGDLLAMRINSAGLNIWTSNAHVSIGEGYVADLDYHGISDTQGGIVTAWANPFERMRMARVDNDGTNIWGSNETVLCDHNSDQNNAMLCAVNGEFVAAWSDERPPADNYNLYVQRFDANGDLLWAADGLPGIETTSVSPNPQVIPSTNGAVIVAMESTTLGLCAQRILSNGTPAWPVIPSFCTVAYIDTFDMHGVILPDGTGGAVAFWSSDNYESIYAAHINVNGQLGGQTNVVDLSGPSATLRVHPSPTDGPMTVVLPNGQRPTNVRALDAQGRITALVVTSSVGARIQLDASELASGVYLLEVTTDVGVCVGRFVIAR